MKRPPVKAPLVGRTERRVVFAILVTAIVPLVVALGLATRTIRHLSDVAFNPEFDQHLERALGVYADLAKAMKTAMRQETRHMASDRTLERAAQAAAGAWAASPAGAQPRDAGAGGSSERGQGGDASAELERALSALTEPRPHVLSASVQVSDGQPLGTVVRARPLDEKTERRFTAIWPIATEGDELQLVVVFAAERARLDELESVAEFAQAHRDFAATHRGEIIDRPFVRAFGALLGATVLFAVIVGVLVVRPATRRINHLAAATRPVAQGDLTVRVEEGGRDEIAELGRAFNQMLETLERNRARIEFLNRIGEWQTMARRLAHEIKNPLTPIQLAVEECHRRYAGDDESYRDLLRTTVEIVVEEIGSLRRLVGEFSSFARLPRARLERADLARFLRDQVARLERVELAEAVAEAGRDVAFEVDIPDACLDAAFDRDMLYRALANLVANAAQATVGIGSPDGEGAGRVELHVRPDGDHIVIDVADDGPGVSPEIGTRVFEPYRTTKKSGAGLGLAIVKKVIIEHGGQIDLSRSDLGGALFRIRIPMAGSSESDVALSQSDAAALAG